MLIDLLNAPIHFQSADGLAALLVFSALVLIVGWIVRAGIRAAVRVIWK